MKKTHFKNKVLFTISKLIYSKFDGISIDKYTIEPIPGEVSKNTRPTNRYLLRFDEKMDEMPREGVSRPEDEARFALSCLALMLGTRLEIDGIMCDSIDVSGYRQKTYYDQHETLLEDLPDLELLFQRLRSMELPIARQFLRACEVYRSAINIMGKNNTLSFFLFTIAIECLSNKISTANRTAEKFVDFILTYVQDSTGFDSNSDLREFLKEIYNGPRSGFTHGGKDIHPASYYADTQNKAYVRHYENGKEVRTLRLKWFESIVRSTLIGFLMSIDTDTGEGTDHLKGISIENATIKIKVKGHVEPSIILIA